MTKARNVQVSPYRTETRDGEIEREGKRQSDQGISMEARRLPLVVTLCRTP